MAKTRPVQNKANKKNKTRLGNGGVEGGGVGVDEGALLGRPVKTIEQTDKFLLLSTISYVYR